MNAGRKGSKNERKTIALLESIGYRCTRSAASKGVWDVVGVSSTDFVLVQCKTNRWPSVIELEAMENFPAPSNARKIIHLWRDRARLPDTKEI